ncbi:MAG: aminomethyl-transferring glycine dehydrogenase subunit GcvPA [Acidobacteriota bacterium]|jgi:glycine dehydrogenase subunit 1|nr:aminomethyl-transferring glycine dehydrogenase subunit GcvPA [Acidobacteriota bacterium]
MRYLPLTDADRESMRRCMGINDTAELFADIPQKYRFPALEEIPEAVGENRLLEHFRGFAAANRHEEYLPFLGGGAYRHFIPEVVAHLSAKGEFLTPYTPYQPEVSQGSLQAVFEYQTMITQLTGMDISNASLYDGGTAAAEALLLMQRKSRRSRILVAESLHPEYREIIQTYIQNLDIQVETVPMDPATARVDQEKLKSMLDAQTGGFIFQSPNFFGVIEDAAAISGITRSMQAYSAQIVAEAMSLAFLKPAGEQGVDIVAGEAQSFGLPLGFGGPYLGFMATKTDFLRQLPGRIVGETVDVENRRGYVLTLSTREQHIKREKATSNICTNQAWCAVRAAMYMATMGETGLIDIARTNHFNTAYFAKHAAGLPNMELVFPRNFFNEVVLRTPTIPVEKLLAHLESQNILGGIPLKWFFPEYADCLLVNITEMHRRSEIDRLLDALRGVQ